MAVGLVTATDVLALLRTEARFGLFGCKCISNHLLPTLAVLLGSEMTSFKFAKPRFFISSGAIRFLCGCVVSDLILETSCLSFCALIAVIAFPCYVLSSPPLVQYPFFVIDVAAQTRV